MKDECHVQHVAGTGTKPIEGSRVQCSNYRAQVTSELDPTHQLDVSSSEAHRGTLCTSQDAFLGSLHPVLHSSAIHQCSHCSAALSSSTEETGLASGIHALRVSIRKNMLAYEAAAALRRRTPLLPVRSRRIDADNGVLRWGRTVGVRASSGELERIVHICKRLTGAGGGGAGRSLGADGGDGVCACCQRPSNHSGGQHASGTRARR